MLQSIDAKLTSAAMFLVVQLDLEKRNAVSSVRNLLGDLSALVRGVGFRIPDGQLSCVTGIGSDAWNCLFPGPRPKGLHPFRAIDGVYRAPSTPGDLLFHIRATRMDLCFELSAAIGSRLEGVGQIIEEVHGFKYFDERDLLGFVDGTENPTGQAALESTLIGAEDQEFAGGSYVIVQKYLHDLKKWNAIPVEVQEHIIGRKKLSDIELSDAEKPSYAHNVLNTIEENGKQLQILRDNMPFGNVSKGEFGTFFIGYACDPARIEKMLQNMFIGNPVGNYDRILDVSTAITGGLFFIPTSDFLDDAPDFNTVTEQAASSPSSSGSAPAVAGTGSLDIGSLKDDA